MSIMKFPKWAIDAITSQMSHFFWGNVGDTYKYHLAKWGLVSQKKEWGGLGVPNLREFNMSLLAAWSKRFFDDKDSDWKKLLSYKYNVDRPNILWSRTGVGSPFWKSFAWAFSAAKTFYRWIPRDGRNISFWHDTWVGEFSPKTRFWDLFVICQQQDASLAQVWDGENLQLTFRRCVLLE
uniref:Reverse transcriptase zinc-binding domain-containing protein n=1 Tax=Aegilops tauschii subsp. strangulata TaxID=200361 RepID=A0A453B0L6_AEGTS